MLNLILNSSDLTNDSAKLIFYRVLLINFVLFTPMIFIFIHCMLIFAWKERYYLIGRLTKQFRKYNHYLHNVLFVFNLCYWIISLLSYLIFSILSTPYALKNSDYYEQIWKLTPKVFLFIVYMGITLHLINSSLYFIYNVKKTNSWFGKKIRQKYPKLFGLSSVATRSK